MDHKRVGIITMTSCLNYGNRLQNYALQETLKKMGFEVETIQKIFTKVSNREYFFYRIKTLVRDILHINARTGICKREKTFKKFSRKYIKYSKFWTYKNCQKKGIEQAYDVFVCGSDQIWNPQFEDTLNDLESSTAYFAPREKRIAYAASMGVSVLDTKYKDRYTELLKDMKAISMREESGAKIVKELTGKEIPVVLDPTLLLSEEEWKQIEKKPHKELPERYIVTYFLGEMEERKKDYIRKIGKKNGLPIIELSCEYLWDKDINDIESFCFDPAEFLYVISHSQILFTDSFHGCVFATLFNKPFRVFDREGTWGDMWSRMQTLVKIIGDDSVVGNANEELDNIIGKNVDYDKANIEKLKQKSLDYLKRALG